ncbi:tautomerase family protein [Streptomyces sp. HNM0574]|uniref:tautomerase family protein n=1 Tax=Streptomyces sp. HNM0574 TaxID=2714954 RepID=UPI00146B5058|nr:tautomerase family protein [Streptomyces sp. HNM0574]NLU71030.1 4-oxalocrotonate tautomerase [Streptomyces sp. HNM0574]
MPLIEVTVAEGRSQDRLRALLDAVHHAARDALDVTDDQIRVLVREVPARLWSAGGRTLAERNGPGPGTQDGPPSEQPTPR